MKKEKKQLKLNIRGTFKNFFAKWYLARKIKNMGVEVQTIKDLSSTQVEILVSGEKNKLWDVVHWSKGPDVFVFLNEVIFEFADPSTFQ